MEDRRRHPRVPHGAWVETEGQGGLTFYRAVNVSLGGMLLRSSGPLPPLGLKVRLRLLVEYESRVMSVHGEVIRHVGERDGEFAIRFVNLDLPRVQFLEELVSECAAVSRVP